MDEWSNWLMLPLPSPISQRPCADSQGPRAMHKCLHLLLALNSSESLTTISLHLNLLVWSLTWSCQVIVPNLMIRYVQIVIFETRYLLQE